MKLKRNDPCHCGSGKKYKHCHLKEDREQERSDAPALDSPALDSPALDSPMSLFADAFKKPDYGPPPTQEEIESTLTECFAEWQALQENSTPVTESPEADILPSSTIIPSTTFPDSTAVVAADADSQNDESDELDPQIAVMTRIHELFERAMHEDKLAILRACIEKRALDSEQATHFFSELYSTMVMQGEQVEFDELTDLFRTTMPELYADENHWFWEWEISNALALGNETALQSAVDQLIKNGGQDLDDFYPVFNCLLYHNRERELLSAIHKYDTTVPESKYFSNAEFILRNKYSDLILNDYMDRHAEDDLLDEANFDGLCKEIKPYVEELLVEGLEEYIRWVGGLEKGQWTLDDFQFEPPKPRNGWFDDDDDEDEEPLDPAIVELRHLSFEFLHYARTAEGISYSKADLARESLTEYILARHHGELKNDDDFGSSRGRSRNRSKRKRKAERMHTNVLLPDHKTLDQFLTRFYNLFSIRTYEGAATFELIPTWIRFLQTKNLVSEEDGQKAIVSMQELYDAMFEMQESYHSDPKLAENLRNWGKSPNEAELPNVYTE